MSELNERDEEVTALRLALAEMRPPQPPKNIRERDIVSNITEGAKKVHVGEAKSHGTDVTWPVKELSIEETFDVSTHHPRATADLEADLAVLDREISGLQFSLAALAESS